MCSSDLRAAAPVDLTGTWVSVISEDWRWRMVTPLKGDAASVPLRPEGFAVVNAWDPAKDEAAGLQCKAYGAPAILRLPTRVRISWQDDNVLKVESDAGTFECCVIEPMVVAGGLFKSEGSIKIWVTDDENHMPVRMASKILIGEIVASLVRYEGVRNPLTSKFAN